MIDKIENQPLIETNPAAGQANQPRPLPQSGDDVSIQVDHAGLIEKAMQPPDDEPQRVAEARDLLASGRLESPQSIREAAQILVNRGI